MSCNASAEQDALTTPNNNRERKQHTTIQPFAQKKTLLFPVQPQPDFGLPVFTLEYSSSQLGKQGDLETAHTYTERFNGYCQPAIDGVIYTAASAGGGGYRYHPG